VGYISFFQPKTYIGYVPVYQEEIQYCTAHKEPTAQRQQLMLPDSSTNLIIAISTSCSLSTVPSELIDSNKNKQFFSCYDFISIAHTLKTILVVDMASFVLDDLSNSRGHRFHQFFTRFGDFSPPVPYRNYSPNQLGCSGTVRFL